MNARTRSRTPSTEDLVSAFRQAKRALSAERGATCLLPLARYEQDLAANLDALGKALRHKGWFDRVARGQLVVVPRAVTPAPAEPHTVSIQTTKRPAVEASLRFHLSPSPDYGIVEVLYLWRFGPALEATLTPNCVGYRLRLLNNGRTVDRHHADPFSHWLTAFRFYRNAPIDAADSALSAGKRVQVVSTDIACYFDSIDPTFLLADWFVNLISSSSMRAGIEFDPLEYQTATTSLLASYRAHAAARNHHLKSPPPENIGIPIGAITSRLVANVALRRLDRHIATRPGVLTYVRYVDDIVVVRELEGDTSPNLATTLASLFPNVTEADANFHFTTNKRSQSFTIKKEKTLIHYLGGSPGKEFLRSVQQSFAKISSERRALLGDLEQLEHEIEAIDLFQSNGGAEHIPRLRDADRFTLRRFIASAMLSALDRFAHLLDKGSATKVVNQKAGELLEVLDGGTHFESADTAFALYRIASLLDHKPLQQRLDRWLEQFIKMGLEKSARVTWNGAQINRSTGIPSAVSYLRQRRKQAIARGASYRTSSPSPNARTRDALLLRHADLRHLDLEDDVEHFGLPPAVGTTTGQSFTVLEKSISARSRLGRHLGTVSRTLAALTSGAPEDPWALVSPMQAYLATRPMRYHDIAYRLAGQHLHLTKDVDVGALATRASNALRGTNYSTTRKSYHLSHAAGPTLSIEPFSAETVRVLVANLPITTKEFVAAAKGKPDLTVRRLTALDRVLREAKFAIRRAPADAPSLLILPELSVPRRWLRSIRDHVAREEIAIVAGIEYGHGPGGVRNEAIGMFPLGYHTLATALWTKGNPAAHEHEELRTLKQTFDGSRVASKRLVVEGRHGRLGVLICSELLEAPALAALRGRIELLAIPAWNDDTASFDYMVHASSSLLVHAFVAVANNAGASDARIVAPVSAPRHARDWARIVHRDEARVVWGDLPMQSLRVHHGLAGESPTAKKGAKKAKRKKKARREVKFRPLPPGWGKPAASS